MFTPINFVNIMSLILIIYYTTNISQFNIFIFHLKNNMNYIKLIN
jgi:hypothetical protein